MRRNIFYRDFTLCKAVALAGLIGIAAALGGVPNVASEVVRADTQSARIIPAMVYKIWDETCAPKTVGVDL